MTTAAQQLLNEAMKLPLLERVALVEGLITSLDKPDPGLDTLWLKEAESRIAAYQAGEVDAVDAEEVFAELGGKF